MHLPCSRILTFNSTVWTVSDCFAVRCSYSNFKKLLCKTLCMPQKNPGDRHSLCFLNGGTLNWSKPQHSQVKVKSQATAPNNPGNKQDPFIHTSGVIQLSQPFFSCCFETELAIFWCLGGPINNMQYFTEIMAAPFPPVQCRVTLQLITCCQPLLVLVRFMGFTHICTRSMLSFFCSSWIILKIVCGEH